MSTETKKEGIIIPETAPVVKRNGFEKTLTEQTFGKTSDWSGHRFWAPVLDVSDSDDVAWAVAENLNGIINKQLRLTFAGIYQDAIEDNTDKATGKLNHPACLEQLKADWEDFTAGVQKLSDLEEQIGLLQDQVAPIVTDPAFSVEDPTDPTTWTPEFIDLSAKMREINKRIIPLRKQLAGIKEVYKLRAAKRKDKETKSATKTEAPTGVK